MPEFDRYRDPRGSSSLLRRTTIYASKCPAEARHTKNRPRFSAYHGLISAILLLAVLGCMEPTEEQIEACSKMCSGMSMSAMAKRGQGHFNCSCWIPQAQDINPATLPARGAR